MSYIVGDAITLTAEFRDSAGALADPTDVTLEVKTPGRTVATYRYSTAGITKSSTGVYTKNISMTSGGLWKYEWQGTGTVAVVGNGTINVEDQLI